MGLLVPAIEEMEAKVEAVLFKEYEMYKAYVKALGLSLIPEK